MADFVQREVSENAFEYLLSEIIAMPSGSEESDTQRLEAMGYNVGYRYVEKILVTRKFVSAEVVEVIKFICKELWDELFKKKIDKLQTNKKGVFYLQDLNFKWLSRYSSDDIASKQAAAKLLHFPCGILRGALANLGILAVVNADFNVLPGCSFNVRIKTS